MTLRDEIKQLASDAWHGPDCVETIEKAALAAIKLVLERPPSEEMRRLAWLVHSEVESPVSVYRAMTAQLMKELEG